MMRPTISYVICATPRSGSFLLCEALRNSGLAGNPQEYFWWGDEPFWTERWGVSNYEEYVLKAVSHGTSSNGVFGAKIMWAYFNDFVEKLRRIPQYEQVDLHDLLPQVFPNLHYIYITRRDKLRQAVSFWKALETDSWAWTTDEKPTYKKEPVFNFKAIDHLKNEIIAHEAAWQDYFDLCKVKPPVIVYEDLVNTYEETAFKILQYLNIPMPPDLRFAERKMKRQSDELTEQWIQAYIQHKTSLENP